MNKIIPLTTAISLAFAITASAHESLPEPSVMLYWSVPIGGSAGDTSLPRYGMRLHSLSESLPSGNLHLPLFTLNPALVDFEMGNHGGKAWKFSGPSAVPEGEY